MVLDCLQLHLRLKISFNCDQKAKRSKSCEIYLEMFIISRAALDKNDSESPTRF